MIYDHTQLQEVINGQKLYFDEYNAKIGLTIEELEK